MSLAPSFNHPHPSSGTVRRTPQRIMRQLRRQEAEQAKASRNAFDAQILIQHLQKAVNANQQPQRRVSLRKPPLDDFYAEDDGDIENDALEANPPLTYDFDREIQLPNGVTARTSTDTISTSNSDPHRNHNLLSAVCTPTERGTATLGPADVTPSVYASARRGDDDLSRRVYEDEIAELRQQRDNLENQLTGALAAVSRLEAEAEARKAGTVAEDENRCRELADARVAQRAAERALAEASKAHEKETVRCTQAEGRAQAAERGIARLEGERLRVQTLLTAERRRVEVLQKEKLKAEADLQKRVRVGAGGRSGLSLEELLVAMEKQNVMLHSAKYNPKWRDDVMKNIDLCLQILYACEDQVTHHRSAFVQRSCAVNSKTGATLDASASVPTPT